MDYFKAKKVGLTTHICGTTYPIYEDLIGCGFTTISFDLDQQADPTLHVDQLARFMEVSQGRAVAIGNVDATLFERATQAEIEAEVRRCVDTAARHSGLHPVDLLRDPAALQARRSSSGSWTPRGSTAATSAS